MSDELARTLRGVLQVGSAAAVIELYQAFATTPLSAVQVAAVMAVLTIAITAGQNYLERWTGTALLKPPSPSPVALVQKAP